jgi:hypothetical protein
MPPAIKVALEARVLRNKGRRYYCDESPSLPTSLRARTTPHALTVRPPVVRVLGSSKAGLPTCGWSNAAQFPDRIETTRTCAQARRLGKISICYATHSLLCDALSQPHSPCGKCPRNEGHFRPCEPNVASNSHASQLTRRIQLRLQQASQPSSPGSEGAKHRDGSHLASTLLASLREQATPIGPPPL